MTYELIEIERANLTHYKGVIQIQGKRYWFILWNTTGPKVTEGSFLTIEDDSDNTLNDTLEKEFAENLLHPDWGIETEVGRNKFRVRVRLHPNEI